MYTYGDLRHYVERMRSQNEKYDTEIDKIEKINEELRSQVESIGKSKEQLTKSTKELKERFQKFEEVRQHLSGICDENKHVHDVVDSLNDQIDALRLIVIHNEKAALLSKFYGQWKQENGLNRQEYARFLSGLDKEQRTNFKEKWTFEQLAGDDEIIDIHEFQRVIDEIVGKYDEEAIRLSKR